MSTNKTMTLEMYPCHTGMQVNVLSPSLRSCILPHLYQDTDTDACSYYRITNLAAERIWYSDVPRHSAYVWVTHRSTGLVPRPPSISTRDRRAQFHGGHHTYACMHVDVPKFTPLHSGLSCVVTIKPKCYFNQD